MGPQKTQACNIFICLRPLSTHLKLGRDLLRPSRDRGGTTLPSPFHVPFLEHL
jgi:hypothetical protein